MPFPRFPLVPALFAAVLTAAPATSADRPIVQPRGVRTMALADSVAEVTKVAQGNKVGVTLTNFGFFGNDFIDRSPSLEYPLGSGIEHCARAGLWIGARAIDSLGSFTGVSSAVHDGNQGFYAGPQSEFTPAGKTILERSNDPSSPFYSPSAMSGHDYITTYSDEPAGFTTLNNEDHRPLNILVKQSVYTWPWSTMDDILFVRFRIINLGNFALTAVHVGFYVELVSGDKNSYTCWPPESACSPYGGWYGKAWLQYDPSLRLLREHYCAGVQVPSGCQLQRAPQWIGLQLLTPPTASQKVTLAGWTWEPFAYAMDTDVERYAVMSAGTIKDLTKPEFMPITGDAVEMLCLGPFGFIGARDSITVDYALVGGAEIADIQQNATKGQQIRNASFNAGGPVAVPIDGPPPGGLAIQALTPNPSRGAPLSVSLSLPRGGDTTVEMIDVTGRVVSRSTWTLAAGVRSVRLPGSDRLAPGVYLVRLSQGALRAESRVAITR
jgi:hypothetical protein